MVYYDNSCRLHCNSHNSKLQFSVAKFGGAVLIFWLIDAYYLMLEQAYRKLYNEVTDTDVEKIDYKMSVKQFVGFSAWLAAFRRPVLLMFYGAILAVIIYIIFYNNFEICLIIKVKE